jgi:hypothetical protein
MFGYSVAISDIYAIVGAWDDNSAHIYDVRTGAPLKKLVPIDWDGDGRFGYSVAISDNYAIVGGFNAYLPDGSAYIFTDPGTPLTIIGNPERFRITHDGKVGIGTTDPRSKLDVKGNAIIGNAYAGIETAPTDGLIIEGNVGIGTPDPRCTMDISATDALIIPVGTEAQRPTNLSNGMIRYNTDTVQFEGYGPGGAWGSLGGIKDVDGDTYIEAETSPGDDNDELKFFTSGNPRMIINSSGYVGIGIGTDSPDARLHLKGAGVGGYPLKIESSIVSSWYTIFDYNEISSYGDDLRINQANNKNVFLVCGGGNVGIGTDSTDARLDIMVDGLGLDGFRVRDFFTPTVGVSIGALGITTLDGNSLQLGCNGSAYMHINSSGNVGIGTTSPSHKLQVSGGSIKCGAIYGDTSLSYYATGYGKHWWYGSSHWAGNSSASAGSYGDYDAWNYYGTHDFIYLCWMTGALVNTTGFIHLSDERIKRDIEDVPDNESLNKVLAIEVRKYGYKDYINKGTHRVTGFIAQEVLKVFPEAVGTNSDGILPNIYKIATGHNYDISENKLILDVSGISLAEDIKIDSKIQIKLLNHETLFEEDIDVYLKEVNDTNIVVECNKNITEKIEKTQEIFIFGSYVDNIHTVNKDKIFTLHHGAIQEIYRIQQQEMAKIAELETEVATLKSELQAIKAHLGI